jgi:hypothetical protein
MVPDEEKLAFKRQAAEMQTKFKLQNPNYSYKRSFRLPKPDHPESRDLRPPIRFCWEQMLNHHKDSD